MTIFSESCVAPVHVFPFSVWDHIAEAVIDEIPDVHSLVDEEIVKEETNSVSEKISRTSQSSVFICHQEEE